MIKEIHHLVIYVSDMQRAKAFYNKVLGLSLGYESPSWSVISAPNSKTYIGLHKTENEVGKGTEISFLVDDLEQEMDRLTDLGVRFTSTVILAAPGRKVIHFEDPDGNPLSLYEINE